MKKAAATIAAIVVLVGVIVGLWMTFPPLTWKTDLVKDLGLTGEHVVGTIDKTDSIAGRFFLASGSVEGQRKINFSWQGKTGDFYQFGLKVEKVVTRTVKGQEAPTVEFVFGSTWMGWPTRGRATYDEIINPNLILEYVAKSYDDLVVIVRISPVDLAKEPALPKQR